MPGGIPGGGGGIIPGGGGMPGGIGIPGGIPGGMPGGGAIYGAPTIGLLVGIIELICTPVPVAGPARPAAGLLIALAEPVPGYALSATFLLATDGGASALIWMMFSPLSNTRPSAHHISRD